MDPQEIIGCFIPECINTSEDPPGKRFTRVPCVPMLRQLWVQAGFRLKVRVPMIDKSPLFCCEDHFDLKKDPTRQWLEEEKYARNSVLKLKKGVLPHLFPSNQELSNTLKSNKSVVSQSNCQKDSEVMKSVVTEKSNSCDSININSQEEMLDKSKDYSLESSMEDENNETLSNHIESKPSETLNKIDRSDLKSDKTKSGSSGQMKSSKNIQLCEQNENKINHNKVNKAINKNGTGKVKVVKIKLIKEKGTESKIDSLKRKSVECQSPSEDRESSQADHKDKDCGRSNKKRRVIKEILAWIPSSPSLVPEQRSYNPNQPFVVVQTPPMSSGTGQTPVVKIPAIPGASGGPSVATVPLAAGKETQFILTVPEKNSSVGGTPSQPIVLAVPQGCSFSVDRLSNDTKEKENTIPKNEPSIGSCNSQDSSKLEENKSELVNFNQIKVLKSPLHKAMSEVATSAKTPLVPRTFKLGETPCVKTRPAQPQPCNTCRCNSSHPTVKSGLSSESLRENEAELSKSLRLVLEEFKSMKDSMDSLKKELCLLRADNVELKAQNTMLLEKTKNHDFCDESKKLEIAAEVLKRRFTCNQASVMLCKPDSLLRVKWTENEIDTACKLYAMSPRSYRFVQTSFKYPLPSITTLKKHSLGQAALKKLKHNSANSTPDYNYDSEEEVKLDEGAIRYLEAFKKLPEKCSNSNGFIPSIAQSKIVSRIVNKTTTFPKFVRVDLQNNPALNKFNLNLPKQNSIDKPTLPDIKTMMHIKPKVVKVQRPLLKQNENFMSSPNIKPIVKEVIRAKKEMIDNKTLDRSQNICNKMLPNLNSNHFEETISKEEINKRSMPSIETVEKNEILSFDGDVVQELVIGQDYESKTNENVTHAVVDSKGKIVVENVPQVVETSDGSKIIRIQVEPLKGEDGTLYEEVVIHCDDASMFDNEVVGLAFGHDDSMEETAFL